MIHRDRGRHEGWRHRNVRHEGWRHRDMGMNKTVIMRGDGSRTVIKNTTARNAIDWRGDAAPGNRGGFATVRPGRVIRFSPAHRRGTR